MRAAAVFLVVALVTPAALTGQQGSILAADQGTHLHPIARLEGSRWVAVPPSGLGQLAPRNWTRWYTQGASVPIRLGVGEPTGRCAAPRRLPIASPPAAGAGQRDGTYVGIAVTGNTQAEPVRRVTGAANEWQPLAAAAERLFARREADHGVSTAALARVPVTMDRVYAVGPAREGDAYYFEASKRIPDAGNTPEEDPKGIVRIIVSGWLVRDGSRLLPAGSKGELMWEPDDSRPSETAPALIPLGVIRQGADRLWVMQAPRADRDRFTIYAVGRDTTRTVLSVDSGAC
jgi:hypothetical protein